MQEAAEKQERPTYKARIRDFIPYLGLKFYVQRTMAEAEVREEMFGHCKDPEKYFEKSISRTINLLDYNVTIVPAGLFAIAKGLIAIVS
jgi:hypothetical protein